jgi:hypothetical protein
MGLIIGAVVGGIAAVGKLFLILVFKACLQRID